MKVVLSVIVLCLLGICAIILHAYISGSRKNRIGLSRKAMNGVAIARDIIALIEYYPYKFHYTTAMLEVMFVYGEIDFIRYRRYIKFIKDNLPTAMVYNLIDLQVSGTNYIDWANEVSINKIYFVKGDKAVRIVWLQVLINNPQLIK